MTIDEMLDKVAEREGVKKPKPLPQKSAASCSKTNSKEHKCNSEKHNCSCGGEHKCNGDNTNHTCSCGHHNACLDLAKAKLVADGVETAAKKIGVKIVVAIVNDGANLMLLHAMDNSYIASIEASQKKAYTAVALKMPTHTALKESRGGSLDGYVSGGNILLLGGGYPLERDGKIFGGIGVSGGTKEQDTLLAQIGTELFRIL